MSEEAMLQTVRSALAGDPRVRRELRGIDLALEDYPEDNTLVLRGTVREIAAKRLARRIAAAALGGGGVRDEVRVRHDSDESREDAALADSVQHVLAAEPVFAAYRVTPEEPAVIAATAADDPVAERLIRVRAADGVVRLSGTVESLSHRRIAEVLAWWARGTCDVDNLLYISPAEKDSDDEIADAVRLVLEKDPWLDAGHIGIRVRERVVTLAGTLPGEEQKRMAENDVWYLPGVHDVVNRIVTAEWEWQDECADEASRESFPASDPPSMTPVTGIGGRSD